MTTRSNIFENASGAVFATKYLLDPNGKTGASYKGIRDTFSVLATPLMVQRDKESAKRHVDVAKQVIETLTSWPLIATKRRYTEHVEKQGVVIVPRPSIENGVLIDTFKAILPSGKDTNMEPFSLAVAKGETAVLRAKSGKGKSVTLMALLHLLEHTGSVHLVTQGVAKDLHEFGSPATIAQNILLVTEEGLVGTERIADRFRALFEQTHQDLLTAHLKKWDRSMVEMAWRTADNLLEAEIRKLDDGEKSVFPAKMQPTLEEIRCVRGHWVQEELKDLDQDGPLAQSDVTPKRVYVTLSPGQKNCLNFTVAKKMIEVTAPQVVLYDEPFAHLDEENRRLQLGRLRALQESDKAVALIIVSHGNVDELTQGLPRVKIVQLLEKKAQSDGSNATIPI